jgi:hypothetical protein
LNADARAVLLQAQLPTPETPAASLRLRGDLRRAQFDRGRDRLRAAGLLVGGTDILTAEGERAARELQENDARLHAGIRYEEREAAISLRGGKDTAKVPGGWQRCELDGKAAFTNGYVIAFGEPPSDEQPARTFAPERIKLAWEAGGANAPVRVRPVAYSEQQGWKERRRHVWLSDGACVDADAFNLILERAPGADLTHEATTDADRYKHQKVLNFYVDGRRVGMLMPYQLDAPAGVAAILETVKADQERDGRQDEGGRPRPAQAAPAFDGSRATQIPFTFERAA